MLCSYAVASPRLNGVQRIDGFIYKNCKTVATPQFINNKIVVRRSGRKMYEDHTAEKNSPALFAKAVNSKETAWNLDPVNQILRIHQKYQAKTYIRTIVDLNIISIT
jgi:hypothetical protein